MAQTLVKKGDCDCCDNVSCNVILRNGMTMCDACVAKENKAIEESGQKITAEQIIAQSKTIDTQAQIKPDVFRLATVAAIELKGAINADETIPESQKDYLMAKTTFERFLHFKNVVLQKRDELTAAESEMRAWQAQAQTFAGKVRADQRAEFKALDLSYNPTPVKSVKEASKSTGSPKKIKMTDVKEAAQKYNVSAQMITMYMIGKTITADAAAAHIANTIKSVVKS